MGNIPRMARIPRIPSYHALKGIMRTTKRLRGVFRNRKPAPPDHAKRFEQALAEVERDDQAVATWEDSACFACGSEPALSIGATLLGKEPNAALAVCRLCSRCSARTRVDPAFVATVAANLRHRA